MHLAYTVTSLSFSLGMTISSSSGVPSSGEGFSGHAVIKQKRKVSAAGELERSTSTKTSIPGMTQSRLRPSQKRTQTVHIFLCE